MKWSIVPPDAAPDPEQIEHERRYAQFQQRMKACGAREQGHAWTVIGEPCERPWLACADCGGSADDAYPDIDNDLYFYEFEIGGRTIKFTDELPDEPSSDFVIPVHLRAEVRSWTSMNSIGPEYETEIEITDRTT